MPAAPLLPQLHRHSLSHVLVIGGSQAEREAIAAAFHRESALRTGPFVVVRCSRQASTLCRALEWWLSRSPRRSGSNPLWTAERGTLLLDCVDALSRDAQRLLLEFVAWIRVPGDSAGAPWAGRLVTGFEHDPDTLVEDGRFLDELYDALDKIRVDLSATRQGGAA
jgi:DNA-binding NtrC family response regulator